MQARLSDVKKLRKHSSTAVQSCSTNGKGNAFEFESVVESCGRVVGDMDRAIEGIELWRKGREKGQAHVLVVESSDCSPTYSPSPSKKRSKKSCEKADASAKALLEALGKVSSNGGEDDSGNIMERARKQMCDADSTYSRVAKLKSDVVNLCLEEELSHMQSEADAMMGKLSMFSADVDDILNTQE